MSCSSSEVAAMMEGLLRQCTYAEIESNHVDTHGAGTVWFAATELLNFRLLPRPKNIGSTRLYPHGQPVLAGRADKTEAMGGGRSLSGRDQATLATLRHHRK